MNGSGYQGGTTTTPQTSSDTPENYPLPVHGDTGPAAATGDYPQFQHPVKNICELTMPAGKVVRGFTGIGFADNTSFPEGGHVKSQ